MNKKKILAAAATLVLSAAFVAGCAGNNDPVLIIIGDKKTDTSTEITFMGYKADDLNLLAMEKTLHSFMEKNSDISISYEGIKGTGYWNALELRYANGCLDDVLMVDQARVTRMGEDLADISKMVDISIFKDLVKSQIVGKDGAIRFVPLNLSAFGLYANLDLLNAWNQPVPTNLAEFTAVCDYFVNTRHVTPIICNSTTSLRTLIEARSLFSVYGLNSTFDVEQFNTNHDLLCEYLTEGIQFVYDMVEAGWIDPEATLKTGATSDDLDRFVECEQPFMITGSWAPLRVREKLKKSNTAMEFSVLPYPIFEDGSVLVVSVNTCIAVNAASPHINEAMKFINHIVDDEFIWDYCNGQCSFSPLANETRIPDDPSVEPTAPYYTNGRMVIGTDYKLAIPLDEYLTLCSQYMLAGHNVQQTVEYLKGLFLAEGDKA